MSVCYARFESVARFLLNSRILHYIFGMTFNGREFSSERTNIFQTCLFSSLCVEKHIFFPFLVCINWLKCQFLSEILIIEIWIDFTRLSIYRIRANSIFWKKTKIRENEKARWKERTKWNYKTEYENVNMCHNDCIEMPKVRFQCFM